MPGFLTYINEEKDVTIERPRAVLQGYDYFEKSFRTSAAKEYPDALCRGMIKACFRALAVRRHRSGERIIHWESISETARQWLTAAEAANRHAAAFGHCQIFPDYQPHV